MWCVVVVVCRFVALFVCSIDCCVSLCCVFCFLLCLHFVVLPRLVLCLFPDVFVLVLTAIWAG